MPHPDGFYCCISDTFVRNKMLCIVLSARTAFLDVMIPSRIFTGMHFFHALNVSDNRQARFVPCISLRAAPNATPLRLKELHCVLEETCAQVRRRAGEFYLYPQTMIYKISSPSSQETVHMQFGRIIIKP